MNAPRSMSDLMYRYPRAYFANFNDGSVRSAEIVLPIVKTLVHVTSVADFGCGTGAWLAAWQRLGVHDVVGCDGPYVDAASLLLDSTRFVPADLATAVRLGRRFDLVQSLEVGEHLAADAAATFVETLVSHAPIVLFSAAPPGQGGEHHVNEQPLEYWRVLFRQHGYHALDALRPRIAGQKRVDPWYRYNSVFFVDRSRLALLDAELCSQVVPDSVPLREYAPLAVRVRNRFVRHVPEPVMTRMATGIRRVTARWRRQSASARGPAA
jgi:SAM-dependent methyltransferase